MRRTFLVVIGLVLSPAVARTDNVVLAPPISTAVIDAPRPVNDDALSDSLPDRSPSVASDGRGHCVAVWSAGPVSERGGTGFPSADNDVFFARSDDGCHHWTPKAQLNVAEPADPGFDMYAQVATDRAGTWLAAWSSDDGVMTKVDALLVRSSDNGATWGPIATLPVPPDVPGNAWNLIMDVESDLHGNWMVLLDRLTGPGSEEPAVVVLRSTDNANSWSIVGRFLEHPWSAPGDAHDFRGASIAGGGDGRWIVTWSETDPSGRRRVFASRSTDNGDHWSSPGPIDGSGPGPHVDYVLPEIATDHDGTWVVAFEADFEPDGVWNPATTTTAIMTVSSIDGGDTWSGDAARIDPWTEVTSGLDEGPSMVSTGRGTFVLSWQTNRRVRAGGPDFDVAVSRSSDRASSWTTPRFVNTNASGDHGNDYTARLAARGGADWIAVWSSKEDLRPTANGPGTGTDGDILFATAHEIGSPPKREEPGLPELCPRGVCGLLPLKPSPEDWCWTGRLQLPRRTPCDASCVSPRPRCCGFDVASLPADGDYALVLPIEAGLVTVADGVRVLSRSKPVCTRCQKGMRLEAGDLLEIADGGQLEIKTSRGMVRTPKKGMPGSGRRIVLIGKPGTGVRGRAAAARDREPGVVLRRALATDGHDAPAASVWSEMPDEERHPASVSLPRSASGNRCDVAVAER